MKRNCFRNRNLQYTFSSFDGRNSDGGQNDGGFFVVLLKDGSHNQGLIAHLYILHLVRKGLIFRDFGPFLDVWGNYNCL